jgi:acyl-CoA synthetase (AMP-forming)/AMP-acid ligase II
VIKKGGSQVIPADIEAVIMQEFPTQVQEVCVVGKPQ